MTLVSATPSPTHSATVSALAEELAGEFRLQPLLEKILTSAVRLLQCHSGSICTIDGPSGTYRKEVDLDVHCQAGQVFQLSEGVTGAVNRTGGFVSFERYADVPLGHVGADDERYNSPVIGVPLTHSGQVIGAFIVFGMPGSQLFVESDVALLTHFATHASIAIVNSRLHSLELDRAVTAALTGHHAGADQNQPDADAAPHRGHGLPDPYRLTTRENEVLQLVIRGLPDKIVAHRLGISAKTVEKHVGTILRKTGARNRTMLAACTDPARLGYGGNPA